MFLWTYIHSYMCNVRTTNMLCIYTIEIRISFQMGIAAGFPDGDRSGVLPAAGFPEIAAGFAAGFTNTMPDGDRSGVLRVGIRLASQMGIAAPRFLNTIPILPQMKSQIRFLQINRREWNVDSLELNSVIR